MFSLFYLEWIGSGKPKFTSHNIVIWLLRWLGSNTNRERELLHLGALELALLTICMFASHIYSIEQNYTRMIFDLIIKSVFV